MGEPDYMCYQYLTHSHTEFQNPYSIHSMNHIKTELSRKLGKFLARKPLYKKRGFIF